MTKKDYSFKSGLKTAALGVGLGASTLFGSSGNIHARTNTAQPIKPQITQTIIKPQPLKSSSIDMKAITDNLNSRKTIEPNSFKFKNEFGEDDPIDENGMLGIFDNADFGDPNPNSPDNKIDIKEDNESIKDYEIHRIPWLKSLKSPSYLDLHN